MAPAIHFDGLSANRRSDQKRRWRKFAGSGTISRLTSWHEPLPPRSDLLKYVPNRCCNLIEACFTESPAPLRSMQQPSRNVSAHHRAAADQEISVYARNLP